MNTTPELKTRRGEELTIARTKLSCSICRRQIARYTCPTCNAPYCSLTCFRSKSHAQCSESFYRKEIEAGIKSKSTSAAEERVHMLELLKSLEGDMEKDAFASVDEDADVNLAVRLEGLDIHSASSDDLMKCLTTEERDRFFSALRNPASDIAQNLIASTELDQTLQAPWWEFSSVPGDEQRPIVVRYGHKPPLLEVPPGVIKWNPASPSLLYNICAVLIAYAYVTRNFSMSPLASSSNDPQDQSEARRLIARAVPFIADRQSRVLYVTLADATTNVWPRLDSGNAEPSAMVVLLRDVSQLVRPHKVVLTEGSKDEAAPKPTLASDPRAYALMALSDLAALFEEGTVEGRSQQLGNPLTMKIKYYAGHLLATPAIVLDAVADEALLESSSVSDRLMADGHRT
ncbi:hypothetical protein J3A83DRAFT_4262045 [Scleroderma citrinum]